MLKVLDVDGAVRRTRGGWLATGEPWTYDTARLRRVAEARTAEQQTMLEYAATDRLPHGVPAPLPGRPGGRALRPLRQLRRAAVRRRGLRRRRWPPPTRSSAARASRSPRRRCGPPAWPPSASPLKGKIAPGRADRARAARSAASPTWAGAAGCAPWSRPEAAGRPDLRRAGRAPWSRSSRPGRTATTRWARAPGGGGRGRLPPPPAAGPQHSPSGSPRSAGCRCWAPSTSTARSATPDPRGNSAQRVRALHDAFTVPPEVAAALADAGRPGPAGRRPGRLGLDDGPGRPGPAPGRRRGRAARWPWPSPADLHAPSAALTLRSANGVMGGPRRSAAVRRSGRSGSAGSDICSCSRW